MNSRVACVVIGLIVILIFSFGNFKARAAISDLQPAKKLSSKYVSSTRDI